MQLPFLTADLAGTGGVLRATVEDFIVDEELPYLPAGNGEHVFARIEKRGLATPQAVKLIATALGVRERDIGVAGMKDRHAVTRQWISLPPPVKPEAVSALAIADIRVLEAVRHPHKLRTGHVRANRFDLRVRDTREGAIDLARAILARLGEPPGAPNWYGEQRFGRDGDNADRGRALVTGDAQPGRDRRDDRRVDRRLGRLLVSALQSELFNRWLTARLADGLYRRVVLGDVLHKIGGGLFVCEDPIVDEPRLLAGEVVVTGPMFGVAMRSPPAGTPAAEREDAILAAAGLTRDAFARVRAIAEGTRRDATIAIREIEARGDGRTLEVRFTLPGGAYATTVMREVMKAEHAGNTPSAPDVPDVNDEVEAVDDVPEAT